jgi:cytochrome P450 family 109
MTSKKRMSLTLGAVLSGAKDGSPEAQGAWYREMHANQPIRYQPEYDLWEVFCYNDVQRVLTDHTNFSAEILVEGFPEAGSLNIDPPQHRRYRALVSKAFTPRRVAQLIPRVASMVDEILEQKSADGWIDIVEQLAYPLPVRVIGEMLGVPTEDKERFRLWSYQLFGFLPNQDNAELMNYFYNQLDQRAKEPRDDLMSALLAAEQDGERLTREEVAGMCVGLLAAGNVTTTVLLSFATRRFVKQPEIFQQIRNDPSLIPGAVEELLRYDFVGAYNMRIARRDLTIRGCEIKEGQVVMAWLSAANFDETYFPHAEQFDIRRSPNPHLTFGHGIHYCLGAPLARMEAKVALERMVAHWSEIRNDPDHPPQYVHPLIPMMVSYPVFFTPVN